MYKIIQIVGTNGKGSVLHNIAKYLFYNGIKVGTFTSPHIISPTERIKVSLQPISRKDFYNNYLAVKNILGDDLKQLTTFEILFFIAIYYFKKKNVEVGIFETGLGGR